MSPPSTPRAWLQRINQDGSRLTRPRRAVVAVMAAAQRALSPLEVYDLARAHYPRLGLSTVYRTLERLVALDLIQRVHGPDGCHAYVAATAGHQHVLLCEGCGRTAYFDGDNLDGLMQQVADRSGFQVHDHWLQFFGLCADCQPSERDH